MHWLIDGYNVLIGNDRGYDEAARDLLGQAVAGHFAGKQLTVDIVYDSRQSRIIQRRPLSVVCSEIYVSDADGYLVDVVEHSDHPRAIVLVTDDREIITAVSYRRPRRMNTGEFLALLQAPPPPERGEEKPERDTSANIERYLWLFGAE